MKDYIKKICPNFDHLVESEIKSISNKTIGWYSSAILDNSMPLGGGVAASRSKARRIALAELAERSLFKIIHSGELRSTFLTDKFPSTSGFAFGFENNKTMLRAIAEASERWIWSKWIDDGYEIKEYNVQSNDLSELSKYFLKDFDSVKFYYKNFEIKFNNKKILLKIGITIGLKDGGAFPGSRVASACEDVWEHGLLEAHRHYKIFKNKSKSDSYFGKDIIYKRINFFGTHAQEAINQITFKKKKRWPIPQLRLLTPYNIENNSFFLWRAICHDFIPWSDGDEKRFIY